MGPFVVVFLIVLVAVFSVQNADPVTISFLVWKFEASLAIVLFLVLLCGVLIGLIVSFRHGRRRKRRDEAAKTGDSGGDEGPPGRQ